VLARPLAPDRIPTRPPEYDGIPRDGVRLIVSSTSGDLVSSFRELPSFLRPGDLLVVNDSSTLPASLPVGDGSERLHLSTPTPDGDWIVEPRRATTLGSLPSIADHQDRVLDLPQGGRAEIVAPYPAARPDGTARLWRARLEVPGQLMAYLRLHGRPVRYGDPDTPVPLGAYQTVFARRPGSAEMPSAARPFTAPVLRSLRRHRVRTAAITLHAGVSSQDTGEPPYAEPFEVSAATAAHVNATRRRGGRVIAVGTTVARALETAATDNGGVWAARGWTEHVIGPDAPIRALDGLLSGWHEPGASHLDLLATVAGARVLDRAYELALAVGVRWHEFGDSHLLLAPRG
jgi:S-adenosylmethionine:tRNA ribosyltransferase-isomerase